MPQVSRIKLDSETEKKLIEVLETVVSKIDNKEQMQTFLSSLLTPTEKLMLAKRLAVVVLIKEGLNDSQIANSLHLTRITVSKMRYYLEARGKGYDIALKILRNEKLMGEFKSLLEGLIKYTIRASGGYVKP
ncbi:MAG: hypothetical protein A3B38_00565 [Candidatus Levybacteria bacterium RIFCSPLOWO2_01_FULL_36_13]|nr:MAG: hypothetical protein A2684_01805 [Candidatus Levybacteria bacterium RIFCSPHIGHO2_01_FULL_36_15b]OGH35380.1 MAG: hypothetical protein A3B38_00565 [Candidatus Levybacteria bacterium RIFCSPLOWO2_01_FULL_36_13]